LSDEEFLNLTKDELEKEKIDLEDAKIAEKFGLTLDELDNMSLEELEEKLWKLNF